MSLLNLAQPSRRKSNQIRSSPVKIISSALSAIITFIYSHFFSLLYTMTISSEHARAYFVKVSSLSLSHSLILSFLRLLGFFSFTVSILTTSYMICSSVLLDEERQIDREREKKRKKRKTRLFSFLLSFSILFNYRSKRGKKSPGLNLSSRRKMPYVCVCGLLEQRKKSSVRR